MTDSSASRRGERTAGRLLAAVSLLGASLGVSAAVAVENSTARGSPQNLRVAESNQIKVESNQKKDSALRSNQLKIESDQKKQSVPAVQSNQSKEMGWDVKTSTLKQAKRKSGRSLK
jgi:hypothetical protein